MEIPILNRKYIFIHGGFSIASHVSLPGVKNDSFKNYFFGVAKLPFYAKVSRPKKVLMHDRCMTSGSLNLIRALIGKVMIFFSGLGILEKMSSIFVLSSTGDLGTDSLTSPRS